MGYESGYIALFDHVSGNMVQTYKIADSMVTCLVAHQLETKLICASDSGLVVYDFKAK